MGKQLQRFLLAFFWLTATLSAFPGLSLSQSAGDVAFAGFNTESPDGFVVVVFQNYVGGDKIHFSSKEWDGVAFTGSGGDFTWVAPAGGITPGAVLTFSSVQGTPSVNIGTITDDANMNLSGSGDVIYAYSGVDKDTPDTPFLGAVATAADEYNGPEGTLTSTGLTQGTTAILLADNIDNAEYIASRAGNTPDGYLSLLNDVTTEDAADDNWDQYNGSDVAPFPPFNDDPFVIVSPPTVHFAITEQTVNETGGTVNLSVELADANGTAINADVIFLGGASSASAGDINTFTTQTVSFSNTDTDGTTKTVTITITDDAAVEGKEIAVFQLQNNSVGSIIRPKELNLVIDDNDAPDVIINEILADPDGDANDDGTVDSGDEFVEIVNHSGNKLDISNWTLSDATSVRYTFPAGTAISDANNVLVVFDEPAQGTGYGGAALFAAGSLSLNNGGDTVTLKNTQGTVVAQVTYNGSVSNQSITRDPDITGSFVAHSTISGSVGDFSPGTKSDGTAFGSDYAIAFRGAEAWRMISSPTQNTTFADLFSNLWMQGTGGSDDPSGAGTLYAWDETNATFTPVINMSDVLMPGKGYIVYAFADDVFSTPGLQGGFPKIISTNKMENISPASVPVTATDFDGSTAIDNNEGWNMLGNPFGTDISVDAVLTALGNVNSNINANVYVWDHSANSGNGDYVVLAQGSGETIAPFQAFWIRYTAVGVAGNALLDRSLLAANQGATFFDRTGVDANSFKLYLGNGEKFDDYKVQFRLNGALGEDKYDAYKLFSLNSESINLFSTLGDGVKLGINVLPSINNLDREIHIPLHYQLPQSGKYTIRWDKIDQMPQQLKVYLVDHKTETKIDLRERQGFSFRYAMKTNQAQLAAQNEPELNRTKDIEGETRFEIVLALAEIQKPEQKEMEKEVTLSPNYPNPFRGQTTVEFKLKEPAPVSLTIWNIVGQKVATIYDHEKLDGKNTVEWTAPGNLPSGIYIIKLEAAGKVLIRKMTLIK